jgi:hypothetical protein
MVAMASRAGLLACLLALAPAGCSDTYECAEACAKVYDRCDAAVEVQGFALEAEQCEVICEEGRERPQDGAALWLDCVEDSVCPGEVADDGDRDLRRYDVTWCNPQFEILIVAM